MSHEKRAAFTLVELLVVIGIIALLISILLPALTAARTSAMGINCASRMRQLSMAIVMYVGDNKGCLPPAFNKASTGNNNASGWVGNGIFPSPNITSFLDQYLYANTQQDNFYTCPQFSGYPAQATTCYSYKYNRYLSGADSRISHGDGYYYPTPWKIAQIKDPSTQMLLIDSSNNQQPNNTFDYSMCFRVDSGADTAAEISAGTAYHLLEAMTDIIFHKSNAGRTGATYTDWNGTQAPCKFGPVNVALADGSVRAVPVTVNQYPMPAGWQDLIVDPNYPTLKY
jgi:prepilin-type N-terminal cleavage/methylation domain-containing protein